MVGKCYDLSPGRIRICAGPDGVCGVQGFFGLRYVLALVACLAFFSPARAMLAQQKETSLRACRMFGLLMEIPSISTRDTEYRITNQTEVTLNGQKCKYDKIPNTAEIIFMEIDSDVSGVILRIHFLYRK